MSGAGDINGDGVDDLIIGAVSADPNGISNAGESYVLYGGIGVGGFGSIDFVTLNGINGFVINGIDTSDRSGNSVSGAGDINGDGEDDLIIGAESADPNGNINSGESYVLFGGGAVGSGSSINLADLDGNNDFTLFGADASDSSGVSVSAAGDVNDDGIDDLIIGADRGDANGNINAGESYVVFGGSALGSFGSINLSAINGLNGFVVNGIDASDNSGHSVSGVGDVNGDGVDDLIIGAYRADPYGNSNAGESYVVFGDSLIGSGGSLELSALDGSNGFVMNGVDADDRSGGSVSGAGDVNGDGVDDLIIGAALADVYGYSSGASYVVFGAPSTTIAPTVEANLVSSCLAGNGRVDLNIVNTETATSEYRLELQGQSPRQRTLAFEDWGRMPITGRPDGTYTTLVKRDGVTILSENIEINCDDSTPSVSSPEVSIVNACRAGNGQVFFQMVNPTSSSRAYIIEFDGVSNRSTTAAPFGQALRGTTGRPDGVYNYLVKTGAKVVDSGAVEVDCD